MANFQHLWELEGEWNPSITLPSWSVTGRYSEQLPLCCLFSYFSDFQLTNVSKEKGIFDGLHDLIPYTVYLYACLKLKAVDIVPWSDNIRETHSAVKCPDWPIAMTYAECTKIRNQQKLLVHGYIYTSETKFTAWNVYLRSFDLNSVLKGDIFNIYTNSSISYLANYGRHEKIRKINCNRINTKILPPKWEEIITHQCYKFSYFNGCSYYPKAYAIMKIIKQINK